MIMNTPRCASSFSRGTRIIPVPKSRPHELVARAVATVNPTLWDEIASTAGEDVLEGFTLRQDAPTTAPSSTIPTSSKPTSSKRVVFFRDRDAWCPYCQRVWMLLLEKQIPFDTMIINLWDKPDWYSSVISNSKTPGIKIDDEYMGESLDIMAVLEERFPERTFAPPSDRSADATKLLERFSATQGFLSVSFRTAPPAEHVEAVRAFLDEAEAITSAHGGPYLLGEFSTVDISLAPWVPMLTNSSVPAVNLSEHPSVRRAVEALMARDSYRATAVDLQCRQMIVRNKFRFAAEEDGRKDMSGVPEIEMRDRREAAAKVALNRDALVARLVSRSGVVHPQGSMFGVGIQEINGREVNPYEGQISAAVEGGLQRVCQQLLSDTVGESPKQAQAIAIQVAAIAYLRNLVSSPRDMSSGAAIQLRLACDKFLQEAYQLPEDY